MPEAGFHKRPQASSDKRAAKRDAFVDLLRVFFCRALLLLRRTSAGSSASGSWMDLARKSNLRGEPKGPCHPCIQNFRNHEEEPRLCFITCHLHSGPMTSKTQHLLGTNSYQLSLDYHSIDKIAKVAVVAVSYGLYNRY